VHATLRWKANVDLDLHCFYVTQASAPSQGGGGFFSKLFGAGSTERLSTSGHIYFRDRGSLSQAPFIELDQDAGIGDQGGDNEENIHFGDISMSQEAIIVANIFNKPNACFGDYDGSVIVKSGEQEVVVPLVEQTTGVWSVITKVENGAGVPTLMNINRVQSACPSAGLV